MSISALVMLPLSGYLYLPVASTTIAASMMPIEGMSRIAALPLNSGLSNSAQDADRALDQVGADAQGIGVVDGRDKRDPLGRRLRELRGVLALDVQHLLRRRALVADHLAVRQLTLGENRGDIVEFLDLPGVHREDVARRHQLLQAEIFGVENVERVRLRGDALGHVVGGGDDVLDRDARLRLHPLGDVIGLIDRGAEIAQHLLLGCPDTAGAGNVPSALAAARTAGRAFSTLRRETPPSSVDIPT